MQNVPSPIERLKAIRFTPEARAILSDTIVAAGFVWLVVQVFLRAWVSEDAYITFRVIDNFIQGYGLRWNIHERVQAYTHPLWMLLHIPVYAVWNNLFHVNIALSILCSAAAMMVVLCTVRKPPLVFLICLLAPMAGSKAFMDYTTSGLENPLAYLLFACFGYVVVRMQEHRHFWFWCSLSVALSLMNRLDTVIIYAPTLLWLVWYRWHDIRWKQIFLGALPLASWFAFSLLYYGFLFPNTKYAKLHTDLRFIRYIYYGLHYIKYFIVMDTMSAAILFITPALWIAYGWKRLKGLADGRSPLLWIAATTGIGVYAYCFYILYIGGDYMIGRFWALPVFVTIWIAYVFMPQDARGDVLFCAGCALLVTYLFPPMMENIRESCRSCVVGRARMIDAAYTFRGNKLVIRAYPMRLRKEGTYHFAYEGKQIAAQRVHKAKRMHFIGMSGFYAGSQMPLIDELALADALLSHLPASKRQNFFAGHFRRDIPKGYNYAIDTGSTERMHPALAKYYEKIHLITSGDLFDPERLKTILYFNLGMYDHWKQEYLGRKH